MSKVTIKQKTWEDKNHEGMMKMVKLSEKANKIGGVLAWTGDRSDDGGFIMAITIPIK